MLKHSFLHNCLCSYTPKGLKLIEHSLHILLILDVLLNTFPSLVPPLHCCFLHYVKHKFYQWYMQNWLVSWILVSWLYPHLPFLFILPILSGLISWSKYNWTWSMDFTFSLLLKIYLSLCTCCCLQHLQWYKVLAIWVPVTLPLGWVFFITLFPTSDGVAWCHLSKLWACHSLAHLIFLAALSWMCSWMADTALMSSDTLSALMSTGASMGTSAMSTICNVVGHQCM